MTGTSEAGLHWREPSGSSRSQEAADAGMSASVLGLVSDGLTVPTEVSSVSMAGFFLGSRRKLVTGREVGLAEEVELLEDMMSSDVVGTGACAVVIVMFSLFSELSGETELSLLCSEDAELACCVPPETTRPGIVDVP